jgi:ABC-type transport system involved in multi-copper enzyme maturation permease subunit
MAFRGGLGPVYAFEWLTATRRWQMYAGRAAFVGLLLLGLWFTWRTRPHRGAPATIQRQAELGRQFYQTLVFIEMALVMLAAPAATAGAICLDKARGTLFHVLVTDLSDSEIVLGKLAARLVPVVAMIAAGLPVLAIGTLLGGIDPVALTGATVVMLGLALLGCTLALTLSIWGRKTHEVLLAVYLSSVVWLLALPVWMLVSSSLWSVVNIPVWLIKSNPFVLTVEAHDPRSPTSPWLGDQVLFLGAAVVLAAAMLALSVARLRPVVIGQWGRAERVQAQKPGVAASRAGRWARLTGFRGWLEPTLDGNPVLWREWHRQRPSRWSRLVWGVYLGLAVSLWAVAINALRFPGTNGEQGIIAVNVGQVSIGLLMLSAMSAISLSEERVRGSLDVLLATPLSTGEILWGKWWGAFRRVPLVALLPALMTMFLAQGTERWVGPPLVLALVLAYGAAITSVGLALATWIVRLGRALALSVVAYVGVTIGWFLVVVLLFPDGPSNYGNFPLYAVMASPPYGVGALCAGIMENGRMDIWPGSAVAAVFWTCVYAAAAALLLVATRATFDRRLGRISELPELPRSTRAARLPKRKPAPFVLDEA